MGSTPNYGWPTPEGGDMPRGAQQITALGDAIDFDLDALADTLTAARVGGVAPVTGAIPSSTSANTVVPLGGSASTRWGGVTAGGTSLFVPVAGLYRVSLALTFPNTAGGTMRAAWLWGTAGDAPPAGWSNVGQTHPAVVLAGGIGAQVSASGIWALSAGQGVRMLARHDQGGALTVTGQFTVELIAITAVHKGSP